VISDRRQSALEVVGSRATRHEGKSLSHGSGKSVGVNRCREGQAVGAVERCDDVVAYKAMMGRGVNFRQSLCGWGQISSRPVGNVTRMQEI
jgi:hypothetical protein